jgi:hypothetical protein
MTNTDKIIIARDISRKDKERNGREIENEAVVWSEFSTNYPVIKTHGSRLSQALAIRVKV